VDLAEGLAEALEIQIVALAGAEDAQTPALSCRRRRNRVGQPRAVRGEELPVTIGARAQGFPALVDSRSSASPSSDEYQSRCLAT
jgi:hypothetical protein